LKLLKLTYQCHWAAVVLLTISLLMTPSKAVANEQTVTNLVDLQKVIQLDLTNRETNLRSITQEIRLKWVIIFKRFLNKQVKQMIT